MKTKEPIESYFDERELTALKNTLTRNGVHFEKSRDKEEDHRMTLQLAKFVYLFFYKNYGVKKYSVALSPNIANAVYSGYTTDLKSVIAIIKKDVKKRYVAYENLSCEDRPKSKIIREVEEILNEYGVESYRGKNDLDTLYLDDNFSMAIREEKGMAKFTMYDRKGLSKYSGISTSNTVDILEFVKTYKSL